MLIKKQTGVALRRLAGAASLLAMTILAGCSGGQNDAATGERQLSWPVDDNYLGRFVT